MKKRYELEDLRVKLEKKGYSNISFVVVNHQGLSSRLKYMHLKNKVSEHIPVYQQEENQTDVWTLLNGNKDDFLIYDRCGRLVYHLGLPFSFLTFPYVEESIKIVYCENKCGNCSLKRSKQPRLHSLILIPITVTITITIMGISILRTVILQSIQNQKHQMLLRTPLLQIFVTTIGTRVPKDRDTQGTEICQ
ncbi:Selenoprotein P [Camelus dromedarius]|uniref:Selenoprotein P n=1 Tax=Camelus dromedarius TaxID=9838 RepID=A0A5N4ECT9_CAMDR|nr:Selenoprotein P [Camelus dromedarius]